MLESRGISVFYGRHRALENVSRSLRDDGFVRSLRQASNREAIWELLDEADHQAL